MKCDRELSEVPVIPGKGERSEAGIVACADEFGSKQGGGNLVQMTLVGGGVKRGIAVVVAGKEEVLGEIDERDAVELAGLGGGVDDGEAGFAF